jgi:predicted nucleic-acid-binding protein
MNSISFFLCYSNITANKAVLKEALKIYQAENVDFVDSILIASNHLQGALIHTFDKKMKKLCR